MKKKTLQKISRLFASLVLVGAMSLGTVATANAAGNPMLWDEKTTPKAAFTVEYKRATGVDIPATDFTVTFEKAGFKQADTNTLASTPTDKDKMPEISDKTVSFTKGETTVKKECADFLGDFLTALATPANTHGAGNYLYNVAQKTPNPKKNNPANFAIFHHILNMLLFLLLLTAELYKLFSSVRCMIMKYDNDPRNL